MGWISALFVFPSHAGGGILKALFWVLSSSFSIVALAALAALAATDAAAAVSRYVQLLWPVAGDD